MGRKRLLWTVLGLGSNIEPYCNLPRAVELLERQVKLVAMSRAWETPSVGQPGAPDFLNAALLVRTSLSPAELKSQVIRPIEAALGRVRTSDKNAPRPIDIDLLLYDGEVLDPELWRQAYLALPVAELLPNLTDPETGDSLAQVAVNLARQTRFKPRPTVLPGDWDCPE
jgi:2-amino-4-hydroxy-6-hydroxymethyldihydropteridine diphosphokinase